ncbi:MAG TPA: cation diffusion facilitator family transporter [Spirochaetota bacterium]|nr:cation diffusion facilitator family transporter [Spirochaetota bacterium]HPS86061.1 cation diffusion facilitator family transporter [Spirochaetota bacterium]
MNRSFLTRYIWLSIAAALTTIILKTGAWYMTGSVGLLSDALESIINLLAALMAMAMLRIAILPPDKNHEFGHGKAEYFSSFVEGLLIMFAAACIAYTAVERFLNPQPLEKLGIGLFVSVIATIINFIVAGILLSAGKKYRSITLEADSHHLMTDVWTSVAVIGGVGAVGLTGWLKLDSIVAFAVAMNILRTAYKIIRRSVEGLMDASLSPQEQETIESVLSGYRKQGIQFHALLTRQGASRRFVSVHVLVPGNFSVHDAHHIAENIEKDIRNALRDTVVFTHIEPVEDEISLDDIPLDR